ncbi:DUF2625 domain-containing protein [Leifsonia shinshuensis]|uniref:DUF2625 family protein n=1 Tax=Leifsonia shinshuensis TaxID=150026 RepID=UPI001F50AD00|nr:DUF2625 family protein [Leifsonia shinshuensis]MCI0158841.1 DUF2625 domain-containing protein [Leifsonia shinshuensis]
MTETDDESVWPAVLRRLDEAQTAVDVLPLDPARGRAALQELQLTERSTMGAIAAHTGGLIVDSGWVRILGGGSPGLPGLAEWAAGDPARSHLVIALDAIGGRFAVDGGGLGIGPGEVCHWGPDSPAWSGVGGGYSAFIAWAVGGGLPEFYGSLRWDGWQDDTRPLRPDEGWALYPPPFAEEGQDTNAVTRAVVPLAELHEFYAEVARQLGGGVSRS